MNGESPLSRHTDCEQYAFHFLSDLSPKQHQDEKKRKAQALLEKRVWERTRELAQTVEALQQEVMERERARELEQSELMNLVHAVEEQREKERQLIQQNRLAAMGEMINNIAHQWRQPLNTLGLYVQQMPIMFSVGQGSEAYVQEIAEKCMTLIQHMSQTIDDFRNYFRQTREATTFPISNVVRQALSLIAGSFSHHGIRVKVTELADPPILGFPGEYTQVIVNILLNARDQFIERQTPQAEVRITIEEREGKSVITIGDNAGGIDEEVLPKIFDPYFTTKGPDKGTGIGLFMSKVIIERNMNGRLTARNSAEGAEFVLEV